jgi:acetylornithine deacetylase
MQSPSLLHCIQILKDLVSYDVLGGQSNLAIMDYIIHFLNERDIEYHLVPNKELNKTSLFCRIGPSAEGGMILSGHTDVVPVEGQDWHTDPFTLTEKDDKLYGRGSCDMKGFLACCLASVDLFKNAGLKKPVYFAFSYDEEIGCLAGPELAAAIKNHYKTKPEFAVIGEPSMMKPVIGQKGICVLETTVHGSAGHSSRIRQEVSAIHVAAKLISWLEDKMDQLISDGRLDERFNPPHTSLHVGMINGGIAPNVIADKCTFYWDVRVIPQDDIHLIIGDYKEYCGSMEQDLKKRFPDTRIVTEQHHPPVPPLGTDETSDIVPLIKKICGNTVLSTVAYAAEAGQFANEGFKTVICGPGDIAQAHRANEFIETDQLDKCLKMMVGLATEFSS